MSHSLQMYLMWVPFAIYLVISVNAAIAEGMSPPWVPNIRNSLALADVSVIILALVLGTLPFANFFVGILGAFIMVCNLIAWPFKAIGGLNSKPFAFLYKAKKK